jgi:hypothetical protein
VVQHARISHFQLLPVASLHQLQQVATTTVRQQHNYMSGDRRSASAQLLAHLIAEPARASPTQQTSEALQSQLRYNSSMRRHRASTLSSRITPPLIGSAVLQPAMSAFRLTSHHALQAHRGSSKPALFRGHHTCSSNNVTGFHIGDTVVKHKTHTVRTQ